MSWRNENPEGVLPDWRRDLDVPACSTLCPSYQVVVVAEGNVGYRCTKIDSRAPAVCLPMVKRMGQLLDKAASKPKEMTHDHLD